MRVLVWNMNNGGPGNSEEQHERGWQYLRRIRETFDVALLQETRDPRPWALKHWASVVWCPKWEQRGSRRPLWGSAVVARTLDLDEFQPAESFPWLTELRGSVAIARTNVDPVWLASVHLTAARVPDAKLQQHPWENVPLAAPDGSVWETDLVPFELRRLFGEETFLWGGDLNSAGSMDDFRGFVGGNRQLRETWREGGSHDLRLRFFSEEQKTFFRPGTRSYQLDHVFGDAATEARVSEWRVDTRPVTGAKPYSDHAPIIVVLDDASTRSSPVPQSRAP